MSQADEEFLAGLGPPPYHLSTETLEKLFRQYKPRDISVLQLINAPAWIEQAGRHSELYRLFWQNVPLLIPAEAFISIINEDTNEDLAKLSFQNVWRFIERYFFGSNYSWMAEKQKVVFEISLTWCFEESLQAEGSFPTVSVNNLAALFEVYNKLQCDTYPDRLVRTFVWKDARGNRRTSKQPNTKRNMTFELGFSLAIHPILDDALDICMESNETAASKQTDEPLPTQNRTFSPEERASLGFGLDTSLAIQKDLTSTLRQDLKMDQLNDAVSNAVQAMVARVVDEAVKKALNQSRVESEVKRLEAMHEVYKTQIRSISQHCDMREYQMANMIKSRRYCLRSMSDIRLRLAPLLVMHDGAVGIEKLWLYNHCRQLERENEAVISELQKAKAELEALKD
ncbi:unnamed protein product [Aureobasidium pullulans]|nr:unnamed protein product [Aureobasidium pullulans]